LHGRGVFAIKDFRAGAIIETAPLLWIDSEDGDLVKSTSLYEYYFLPAGGTASPAIGLGYSALYNHSYRANASYGFRSKGRGVVIRAHQPIPAGEEITINYNGDPEDQTPISFSSTDCANSAILPRLPDGNLYVGSTRHKGRGVFSKRRIQQGEMIEACPFLTLSANDNTFLSHTRLADYLFELDKQAATAALALGFGSLYNHARFSNAAYSTRTDDECIIFSALEDIPAGREICINYGGHPGKEYADWFASRNLIIYPT
jgi:SET domain-containing protein